MAAAVAVVPGFLLLAAGAAPSAIISSLHAPLRLLPIRARIVAKLGVEGAPKSFARGKFVARAWKAENDDEDVWNDEQHSLVVEELDGINSNDQNDFKKPDPVIGVESFKSRYYMRIVDLVWTAPLQPGFKKWQVIWDETGRPIGGFDEAHKKLDVFLTLLIRTHRFCPLTYVDWESLIKLREALLFEEIEKRFVLPSEAARGWCMDVMHARWLQFRSVLKVKYFVPTDREASIRNFDDDRVPMASWERLVDYWMSPKRRRSSVKKRKNTRQSSQAFVLDDDIRQSSQAFVLDDDTRQSSQAFVLDDDFVSLISRELVMRRNRKRLTAQSDISSHDTENIHEQQSTESTTPDINIAVYGNNWERGGTSYPTVCSRGSFID